MDVHGTGRVRTRRWRLAADEWSTGGGSMLIGIDMSSKEDNVGVESMVDMM